MLTGLSIRNVVLIDALDLAFAGGLGVLTGETGAGKSILLDALGLVLGDRADSGLVRAGTDQASVTASFEFDALPSPIRTILHESEIDVEPGEPLILKRRLRADGGSKAFVNDQPVGMALLRDMARHLVERGSYMLRRYVFLLLMTPSWAQAGTVMGNGGATEITQIANNLQTGRGLR